MQRRKFLIGAGSAAVGASALIGSGAFTSVQADRDATIDVTTDSDAYLALSVGSQGNDAEEGNIYAEEDDDSGQLSIEIDKLNPNAVTTIDDVISITNDGSQSVGIQATVDDDDGGEVTLTPDLENEWESLGVGNSQSVDIEIDTDGVSEGESIATKISFTANADQS